MWQKVKEAIRTETQKTLGRQSRKLQNDWFCEEQHKLIENKNEGKILVLCASKSGEFFCEKLNNCTIVNFSPHIY